MEVINIVQTASNRSFGMKSDSAQLPRSKQYGRPVSLNAPLRV